MESQNNVNNPIEVQCTESRVVISCDISQGVLYTTENGSDMFATTSGLVMLPNGMKLSVNLFKPKAKPRKK